MKKCFFRPVLFLLPFLLIVMLGISSAHAAAGKWGTTMEEALEALKLKGDVDDGEDIYTVCAACHLPTGWGDLAGTFPQLAGQHATVLIKQIADIRAKNRDNPTMYPFAIQIEGAQDLADVSAYIQTLKMNPDPPRGPNGPLYLLTNLRKDTSKNSLDVLEGTIGTDNFKNLKKLEEKRFQTEEAYLKAVSQAIGPAEMNKYKAELLKRADWGSDLKLGKKLFEENCVKCHGDHGQGNYKDYYPVIAGQTYLYLIRQFYWIEIGKRRNANPDMVKQIAGFTPLDMRSVVDYGSRFEMKKGDWKKVKEEED